MVALASVAAFILVVSGVCSWWAKSSIQQRLVTKHRETLKSLKVRGAEELRKGGVLQELKHGDDSVSFSVEIDGKVRPYRDLYKDADLLSRFDDPELVRLSRNFKKWLFLAYGSGAALFVCILIIDSQK